MPAIPQSALALYNSQLDASQEVADAMFVSVEKAEKLILDAARHNFEEQLKFAQSLAAARDPQGFAALQKTFFGHNPERAMEYQKQVMQIIMEANSAFGHALETCMQGAKASADAAASGTAATATPAALAGGVFPMWDAAFKEFTKNANRLMQTGAAKPPAKPEAPARQRSARAH
jgi:phasin family protein